MSETASLPLSGVRVLDLTRALAGPFCTMILGDLGADVVKVEPSGGDMIREWGPFDRGTSAYFLSANRNKRGVAVNFRDARGLELLRGLARDCDVVVENFRPGAMEAMGLGYEALAAANPRLIYASVTGFGSTGPAGERPGFDQIAQGYSGLMSVTGSPETGPVRVGVAIGDQAAGMWCAIGVLAALAERGSGGRGRRVETSLLAGLVALMSVQAQRYLSLGEVPGLAGNTHPVISPYGAFETADGLLNIAPATSQMWKRVCAVLDLQHIADDPRYATNAQRIERRQELKSAIEARLKQRTRAEWTELLLAADVPAGPINNLADVFADGQVIHSRLVEEVEHAELGTLRQVGSPITLDGRTGESIRSAPPVLGEHTYEVLQDFGYARGDLDRLAREGVISQHSRRMAA
ncbi:MAG TPA: CoA transferase [Ramlibacter sp.]|uniref:CaiB/BaiF CoA transferase family protein n=1 Tax=Ramlibacter sp. TaxID=1917967 RepID=UPI002CDF2FFA|nr:CoA transferase [Ramlibacter sp.]HVZ45648.1 CoA transferase [Ramlibacter sp.]